MLTLGSLFSGAGGLDIAVEHVFGAETIWHCENDPTAARALAAHWPDVPNYGDVSNVTWGIRRQHAIDILCAGWPCQPFSLAGKRKGAEDERALWPQVARAVRILRPRIVVLENVSAVLGPEFQRVANDLAALGYDIAWTCLRASDVGAPHRRERLFIVATDTNGERHLSQKLAGRMDTEQSSPNGCDSSLPDTSRDGRHEGRPESARIVGGSDVAASGAGPVDQFCDNCDAHLTGPRCRYCGERAALLPTPNAQDGTTGPDHPARRRERGYGASLNDIPNLLPTPRTSDTNGAGEHGAGGMDLRTAVTLLPTPTSRDHKGANQRGDDTCLHGALLPTQTAVQGRNETSGRSDPDSQHHSGTTLNDVAFSGQWGKYEPAIRRWESLTRGAPSPTEPNTKGNPRLSAAFSEWMMGWPAGWVTDVPGISRNDALRIIGNGVVPQQATAALTHLQAIAEGTACHPNGAAAAAPSAPSATATSSPTPTTPSCPHTPTKTTPPALFPVNP